MSRVVELEPRTGLTGRLPFLNRIVKRSVDDGGGNRLLELTGHIANGLQQPFHMKSVECRGKDDRRVVEKEHLSLNPVTEHGEVIGLAIDMLTRLQ